VQGSTSICSSAASGQSRCMIAGLSTAQEFRSVTAGNFSRRIGRISAVRCRVVLEFVHASNLSKSRRQQVGRNRLKQQEATCCPSLFDSCRPILLAGSFHLSPTIKRVQFLSTYCFDKLLVWTDCWCPFQPTMKIQHVDASCNRSSQAMPTS